MFQKVHLKLTLLCAGITIFIIAAISGTYLYISEKNLKENSYVSFQNDMNTLLSNLENQTLITYEWLSKMEGNGKYLINIWDNGTELLFNNREKNHENKALFETARAYYDSHFMITNTLTPYYTYHQEFSFSSVPGQKEDYYGCAAFSYRETGTLEIYILKSLAPLRNQIKEQRILFSLLILLSSGALFLFSWHFTKRLLSPVEENHKKQLQFISAASHELRTPLSVLLSAASACEKADRKDQQDFFKIIKEEGNSMSRLITDLLTLAGADSHSWTIAAEPCEADTLLLETFEAFEPLARQQGYSLKIKLPDTPLPTVNCDKERIRQVLFILIDNAFHYTPPGSQITLSLAHKDRNLLFFIADNGSGIPDDQKERIFDRFYRADKARSESGHFGLGLSIAKEIMESHKGSIQVRDAKGGGAEFILTLPLSTLPQKYNEGSGWHQ